MRNFVVLDDRFEDRFFLCRTIRHAFPGIEPDEFIFADDAFTHLESLPDEDAPVVFVHINIPGKNGFDFIELCQDQIYERRKSKPVFVVMSNVISPEAQREVDASASIRAAVPKPVTKDKLLKLLNVH